MSKHTTPTIAATSATRGALTLSVFVPRDGKQHSLYPKAHTTQCKLNLLMFDCFIWNYDCWLLHSSLVYSHEKHSYLWLHDAHTRNAQLCIVFPILSPVGQGCILPSICVGCSLFLGGRIPFLTWGNKSLLNCFQEWVTSHFVKQDCKILWLSVRLRRHPWAGIVPDWLWHQMGRVLILEFDFQFPSFLPGRQVLSSITWLWAV